MGSCRRLAELQRNRSFVAVAASLGGFVYCRFAAFRFAVYGKQKRPREPDGSPRTAVAYTTGKLMWTLDRVVAGVPTGHALPLADPAEANAVVAVLMGRIFKDLFPEDLLKRECGCER